MTEKENRAKASILIQYIVNIFREDGLQSNSQNSNVDLFLLLAEKENLISNNNTPCSKKVNDMLNKTFFKKILEIISKDSPVPPLKRYEIDKEIAELTANSALNLFFSDLVKNNQLSIREFAECTNKVANEYLQTLKHLYYSQHIKGKQDAFDSLNVNLTANLNNKTKKRRV